MVGYSWILWGFPALSLYQLQGVLRLKIIEDHQRWLNLLKLQQVLPWYAMLQRGLMSISIVTFTLTVTECTTGWWEVRKHPVINHFTIQTHLAKIAATSFRNNTYLKTKLAPTITDKGRSLSVIYLCGLPCHMTTVQRRRYRQGL